MNILNVVRHPTGGIRTYLQYNYSRLDPAAYKVTVVTIALPEVSVLVDGMKPVQADLELVPPERPFPHLVRKTRQLIAGGRFQLLHSQGLTAGIVGVLANTPKRLPHVLTLHETFHADQFKSPVGPLKRRFLSLVVARADRVILVGQDAFDNLTESLPLRPASLPRLEIIRNGVAVATLVKEAAAVAGRLREFSPVHPLAVLIGFVGRFMPEKGFPVLIDAVERLSQSGTPLPPFQVVAVNDGGFIREYKGEIERRGLSKYFVFLPLRPSVASLLLELDAVAIPSLREACPLLAMEALTLGCPLVASDCIGLREVTRGGPALVSRAGDPVSLSEALYQVIMAPAELRRIAAGYVSEARQEFDSDRTARRLDRVFRQLVAEAHPSATQAVGR